MSQPSLAGSWHAGCVFLQSNCRERAQLQEGCTGRAMLEFLNACFHLQDESECTSDEEIFISQDEIQSFMANNKSFYSNREQYRQHLKEKFNKYCRLNDHKGPICNGWLTTAGAN